MTPLISIIIPVFNRASLILETLDSVKNQSYTHWECIIIDDGSTDDTKSVIENYIASDLRFSLTERPKSRPEGGNAARNYGFECAKGDYIQWFDSDDVMHKDLLHLQLENLITTKKKLSICLFNSYNEDLSELTKQGIPNTINYSIYYDYINRTLKANLPTILFDKTILGNYKLSESLLKSQEFEFLQRIFRAHETDCVLLNQALVKVRRHSQSITYDGNTNKWRSVLDAFLIVYNELPNNAPKVIKKSILKQYLQSYQATLQFFKWNEFLFYGFQLLTFHWAIGILILPYLFLIAVCFYIFKIKAPYFKPLFRIYSV